MLQHVLSTMGGQGQPQIIAQLLLRLAAGESAESAVAAPRTVVGVQAPGTTTDSVSFEDDLESVALESLTKASLPMVRQPACSDLLSHANVEYSRLRQT